jgi:hypothetical protein
MLPQIVLRDTPRTFLPGLGWLPGPIDRVVTADGDVLLVDDRRAGEVHETPGRRRVLVIDTATAVELARMVLGAGDDEAPDEDPWLGALLGIRDDLRALRTEAPASSEGTRPRRSPRPPDPVSVPEAPADGGETWLSLADAAARLGIHERTLRRHAAAGDLDGTILRVGRVVRLNLERLVERLGGHGRGMADRAQARGEGRVEGADVLRRGVARGRGDADARGRVLQREGGARRAEDLRGAARGGPPPRRGGSDAYRRWLLAGSPPGGPDAR